MRTRLQLPVARRRTIAMTLLELLVAMSLLTVIVLGLYLMFDRVLKAFRGATTQVDVLDGGRSTLVIFARDFEQMQGAGLRDATINEPTNSLRWFTNVTVNDTYLYSTNDAKLLLLDSTPFTNAFREIFFLCNTNGGWQGVGYRVATRSNYYESPANKVGTLLRFEFPMRDPEDLLLPTNNTSALQSSNALYRFTYYQPEYTNDFQPVLEGVVHANFHVIRQDGTRLGYDTNGAPDGFNSLINTNMPTFIEIEIGVLEPQVADQVRALPVMAAQTNFLYQPERTSQMHLFRMRIPIRQGF